MPRFESEEDLTRAFTALLRRKDQDVLELESRLKAEKELARRIVAEKEAEMHALVQKLARVHRRSDEIATEYRRVIDVNRELSADQERRRLALIDSQVRRDHWHSCATASAASARLTIPRVDSPPVLLARARRRSSHLFSAICAKKPGHRDLYPSARRRAQCQWVAATQDLL